VNLKHKRKRSEKSVVDIKMAAIGGGGGASGGINLGTKEVRDLTRMERIGAHSHIRGTTLFVEYLLTFSSQFPHTQSSLSSHSLK
jgi:hypothetical protein